MGSAVGARVGAAVGSKVGWAEGLSVGSAVGDKVGEDDTIGLIEVMKSFHEVKAGVTGNIVSFKVEDTQAITPGDIIAEIEI